MFQNPRYFFACYTMHLSTTNSVEFSLHIIGNYGD